MKRVTTLAATLLVASVLAGTAAAQTLVGTIAGRVSDEQGAVLPGVSVTLTGRTGASTSVTDAEGNYRFPALEPGTYAVKVELAGFSTLEEQAVVVGIGKEATVDFAMKVGGLQESIEVTANATMVDAASSSTDNTLSQDLLFSMPISRTNAAVNLLNNSPGINSGSAYGGAADAANALLLDGVDTRDPEGGTAWTFFNYNIIEEVQVGGLGATAEYGGFTGAVVNTITKSGGNRSSGLFELRYTNDDLGSTNVSDEVIDENPSLGQPNVVTKLVDYTVQLGGAIKKDKAFYFGSIQRYSVRDDPQGPRTLHTEVSPRFNGKVTFQPSTSDTIIGNFQYDTYNQTGRASGIMGNFLSTQQQTQEQDSPEWIWNGQYRKVIGSNTFFEAKFTGYWGYFDLDPVDTSSYHFDGETSEYTGGAGYSAKYDRLRNQVNASLSRYASGFGSHNFKFGVEIERSKVRNRFAYSHDVYFYDYGGVPLYAYGYAYDVEGKNKRDSFYGQDSWKFGRVTANLGLRVDRIRGADAPTGDQVYSTTGWGPRLGVAVDLAGTGTSVLRGFWGRYYDGAMFSIYSRAVPGFTPFFTYEVLPNGSLDLVDETPPLLYGISDDIDHPAVDDFNVSFEQQIRRGVRLAVTGIWRNNMNFVNSVIDAARFTAVQVPDGLNGGTTTAYRWANQAASEDTYFIRNVDGYQYLDTNGNVFGTVDAKRNYQAFMVVLSRAYSNRWGGQVSYVWSRAEGTITNSSTAAINTRQFESPSTALINVDGHATNDRTHEFKAYLSYTIPKIEVGANMYYRSLSGTTLAAFQRYSTAQLNMPFNAQREPFLEPRGSFRNDHQNLVDVRFEKVFGAVMTGGDRIGIYTDISNLFNSGVVTNRYGRVPSTTVAGFPNPVPYYGPSAVIAGRQITLGGRYSF